MNFYNTKLKDYINVDLFLKYIDNKWIEEKGKRFSAYIDIYFHFEENDIILNKFNIHFFNLLSLIIHLSFISSFRTLIS